MSMFEDQHYRWRETYLVLFASVNRPTLKKVERALGALSDHYTLVNPSGDDAGMFESLTLIAPDDFSALDICFSSGEEVLEQGAALIEELRPTITEASERAALKRLRQFDGRFDVLHFERIPDYGEEGDDGDETVDPGALLLVLTALAKMTGGVAIDPQSGTVISEED